MQGQSKAVSMADVERAKVVVESVVEEKVVDGKVDGLEVRGWLGLLVSALAFRRRAVCLEAVDIGLRNGGWWERRVRGGGRGVGG